MGARFRLYATASAIATAAMMWYAYSTRVQFYPTVIYLVTSKLSVAVSPAVVYVAQHQSRRMSPSLLLHRCLETWLSCLSFSLESS